MKVSLRGGYLLVALMLGVLTTRGAELPATETLDLGGGLKMEFVLIRPGSFTMGSDENSGAGDESPEHKVTFTQPFYFGTYEVTQEQWQKIMSANPSTFKGPKRPVETVSWNDCQIFLAKLHDKTGRNFALPTESQWEYACRAGTTTPWSFGNDERSIADFAWFRDNSGGTTHPVGEKKPNAWGLCDIHGNVGEWCADAYAKHAYPTGAVTDPSPISPSADSARVWRGGAWGDSSDYLRSAYRNCTGANGAHHGIGLRCVMLVPTPPTPLR